MKKIKKDEFYFYTLLVFSLFLVFSSIFIWTSISRPIGVEELDVRFIVGENPGFDLDLDVLAFGRIQPGMSSTRKITINNPYDFPIEVKIFVSKNIAEYIVAESSVYIYSDKNISLTINLIIPEDLDFGNYSGKIRFETYNFP